MYIDGKTIFVAGATGLAGSSIVRALLDASSDVRVRGGHRGDAGYFIEDDRLEYSRGDIRNAGDCARLISGCDAVVFTAAVTGGALQAVTAPWLQVTDNVVMDLQLVGALQAASVRRAVYVSSATVYQEYEGFVREDQLDLNLDPAPAYVGVGWAKRYAEKLCAFWHRQAGIAFSIARTSNIYGPFARFDPNTANFIPALIRKAADKMDPFEVWGTPQVARDIIFAADFGRAIVALLNTQHTSFDIFNVGSGRTTSVGDAVTWALRHAGHQPSNIVWRNDKPSTLSFRALDCSKISRITGWKAATTPEDGIAQTVRWWLENRTSWTR
ncbi:MAG: NAD(P)-dependent oxidoreductase [Rhodospirillaceae bacterium]|nr:NAD(P)-dependent oxidoreductase [Rhodospirillaceae bacterium]